ncbi:hypothetical protein OAH18_02735 [bacterium]|nr:hypothetical protein [bacterium]
MSSQPQADDGVFPVSRRSFAAAAGLGLASLAGVADAKPNTASPQGQKMATAPEGYEGNIAVCTFLIVKASMEKETDAVWDKHKQWLKETHGPWGMVSYTVAKHKELKFPLQPGNLETTNRIIYCIHEVYRQLDGLKKHYKESPGGGYLDEFTRISKTEGNSLVVLQGAPITHSLLPQDCEFPVQL